MFEPVRVTKESKKEKKKRTAKLSGSQVSLLTGRTADQEQRLKRCSEQIQMLRLQHEIVMAILDGENEDGIVIAALDLERYGGSRLDEAWIWLHPLQSEGDSSAPDPSDYIWGGYFAQHSKDVERYVRDRAKWFYPLVKEELEAAEERLKQLRTRRAKNRNYEKMLGIERQAEEEYSPKLTVSEEGDLVDEAGGIVETGLDRLADEDREAFSRAGGDGVILRSHITSEEQKILNKLRKPNEKGDRLIG